MWASAGDNQKRARSRTKQISEVDTLPVPSALPLLLIFLGVLRRLVTSDDAPGGSTEYSVMMKMTGCAAHYGAFNAAFGVGRNSCTSKRER